MIKFCNQIRQQQKSYPDYFDRLSTSPNGMTFASHELMYNVRAASPLGLCRPQRLWAGGMRRKSEVS